MRRVDRIVNAILTNKLYLIAGIVLVPLSYWTVVISLQQYYYPSIVPKAIDLESHKLNTDLVLTSKFDYKKLITKPFDTVYKTLHGIDSADNDTINEIFGSNAIFKTDSLSNQIENYNEATTSSIKILQFDTSVNNSFVLNTDAIQMTEPAPKKGFGKLAIRTNCSYCPTDSRIEILSMTGSYSGGGHLKNYDPENKRTTSLIKELLPGTYKIIFDYNDQGQTEVDVEVFEGKVSLFKLAKKNPFGEGNARLVFSSKLNNHRWKIILDNKSYGWIELKKGQELHLNLSPGWHDYEIENAVKNNESLDNNTLRGNVYIPIGSRVDRIIE